MSSVIELILIVILWMPWFPNLLISYNDTDMPISYNYNCQGQVFKYFQNWNSKRKKLHRPSVTQEVKELHPATPVNVCVCVCKSDKLTKPLSFPPPRAMFLSSPDQFYGLCSHGHSWSWIQNRNRAWLHGDERGLVNNNHFWSAKLAQQLNCWCVWLLVSEILI